MSKEKDEQKEEVDGNTIDNVPALLDTPVSPAQVASPASTTLADNSFNWARLSLISDKIAERTSFSVCPTSLALR